MSQLIKLRVNNDDEITGYATSGDISDSIEFKGNIPDRFEESFKPSFYLLQNDEIIVNPNYEKPVAVDSGPSQNQQQLAAVTYQQMMTTQDVTTLQTQNAQMAYQLMMMQKQGGEA